MASTSLTEQLRKLAAPQTSIYKDDKKRASLLFDPKEAALKDRDTFYDIGLSGLKELIALYEGFRVYEDSLFSISSKDFERGVQSKEANKNLDQTIEKFLMQLSPYFVLQSSHKALEWLVNRYHIHEYNQDAIMALILPYHETKIFVRFVQLLEIKSTGVKWNWLEPMQNHGVTLTKQGLHSQCISNTATLQFIAKTTIKYVHFYGDRASQLNTVFAFFCSTAIGTINSFKGVSEAILNALLPTLISALESNVLDFRLSAYVIFGYLVTKAVLKKKTVNEIVDKLFTSEFGLTEDAILLINLTYTNQKHMTKMSECIVNNISVDTMHTFCSHLKKLVEKKINIHQLIMAFLSGVLPLIQEGTEEFMRYSKLPEILVDDVDLKNQQPEKIISCVLNACVAGKNDIPDEDGSDIEIVDENDNLQRNILHWFSMFLKKIESNYPNAFDKIIKSEMSSKSENTSKRRAHLSKVLGFNPAIAHKMGGSYLFENLNNINPDVRVEAVNYIAKKFNSLNLKSTSFVKESVINRLHDDEPNVVMATLSISNENLNELLNETELSDVFTYIISKKSKDWYPVIKKAIMKLCSLEGLPVNHKTVLTLAPYLFPDDKEAAILAWQIIYSAWGVKLGLKSILKCKESDSDNSEVLKYIMFKALFTDKLLSFDSILEIEQVKKENTLDICLFLLLKTCSIEKLAVEDIIEILNLFLSAVKTKTIINSEGNEFSSQTISEFLKAAKDDEIVFQVLEYIFGRITECVKPGYVTRPWCNVCEKPGSIFVRMLFEIFITGCAIRGYSENYAKLLQKLLNQLFTDVKEKFNFIANIAFGHILYAHDPKVIIGPELQLRALKLLKNFVGVNSNNQWIFDSDVFILTVLFNLNHPIAVIREATFELIDDVLNINTDTKIIYIKLLQELIDHREEILLDHEQIQQIIKKVLTKHDIGGKIFKKNCMLRLTGILVDASSTPAFIKSALVELLSKINNSTVFYHILLSLRPLCDTFKQNELNSKFTFDIYTSKLFINVINQLNEITVSVISKDEIWHILEVALKEYKECILEESLSYTSPCVHVMKQINEDIFKKVPDEKCKDLICLITAAGTFSNNPTVSSVATKTMKKIQIKFDDFKSILEKMLNVRDPAENLLKKKKTTASMLTYQVVETDEWRLGVTLLEYIQNKKKMSVDTSFVSLLFRLLYKCLRFEEQSHVEYAKQLILSSFWYYLSKNMDNNDEIKAIKSVFEVELIVQCIRGTQNPQTHHHALLVLCQCASILPEQVLNHIMEIFTFMGSSVLRHDDAYSFQIITKIIERIIPILVYLDKNVEDCTDKELLQLQKRVVPVFRIFADVVLHVPEHRRIPLYKKLIETLGPYKFLWVFIALLLETHITHFNDDKNKNKQPQKTLADKESPMNRLDFGLSITLEFPPEVAMENFIKLIVYMKSLPVQKDDNAMEKQADPSDIFSVNSHSAIQLRHYKYVIITFLNTALASSLFIHHNSQAKDISTMENHYKSFIINILTYIQSITKISDDKTAKYWRVMLHHSYDLLDHVNNLLSPPMFVSVVRGLLKHTLQTVRRKAMELLNLKIQCSPEMFDDVDRDLLFSLCPPLVEIVQSIEDKRDDVAENTVQELELNQQTALLSLKLLTRLLGSENPKAFLPVLEVVTHHTCNPNISPNVMASIVLCLAELCGILKVHALVCLRKYMPALIKVLKKQRKADTPELVLLSTVTAISKIVECLPLYLSPYLEKIIYEYAILLAKWQSYDQDCNKVSALVTKLINIKKKIASSIPPRILIPVANETHKLVISKGKYEAVAPIMSILADCFANITTADFTALQKDLTSFFLSALQLRCDADDHNVDHNVIDKTEDSVVNALVSLVLKLSETSFRPFYFKIYDWAIRTNVEGRKDRTITFYSAIAEKLKGLFVLFAGHFIKNAADLLDACNNSKTEEFYFDSEDKCITLVKFIIKTLHNLFLYDSQQFLNKDRFETLMQPVVDQLENTIGGIPSLKERATELIIPCISQFAVATADDSLWKLLNYQVLLKTRHNDAEISNWLPLLAESVPFLAELLEDGDQKIETATKNAIRTLEQILGEPLEKYF
ncbi:unnamed protein product [Leptidea sinapis]|uniref:HEAT repeat-containing protein 1 n=1 Tax=Leptidea sinapis TaxID=189913 RepID=A0A5E4Q6J7_9NEOP|nr:unnamed protein product [Leptidea sinapis]